MAEQRTILEKTFALTSQQQEGTVTLLDLTVELRKIPATVERQSDQPNGPIVIATTRRYAQGQILVDRDIAEVEEEAPAETEEAAAVPVGIARQEIIDSTTSDDDDESEETPSEHDSETTERNPNLEDIAEHSEEHEDSADPHPSDEETASGNGGEPDEDSQDRAWPDSPPQSPPPYSSEPTSARRRQADRHREFRDGVRSPSPPGYMPSYYLQNLYSPPILLRSEEEYRHHRRELIRQHKRDCLDLYYRYEFYSQQLKRARRQYY